VIRMSELLDPAVERRIREAIEAGKAVCAQSSEWVPIVGLSPAEDEYNLIIDGTPIIVARQDVYEALQEVACRRNIGLPFLLDTAIQAATAIPGPEGWLDGRQVHQAEVHHVAVRFEPFLSPVNNTFYYRLTSPPQPEPERDAPPVILH
jgi:hypothetical protein